MKIFAFLILPRRANCLHFKWKEDDKGLRMHVNIVFFRTCPSETSRNSYRDETTQPLQQSASELKTDRQSEASAFPPLSAIRNEISVAFFIHLFRSRLPCIARSRPTSEISALMDTNGGRPQAGRICHGPRHSDKVFPFVSRPPEPPIRVIGQ